MWFILGDLHRERYRVRRQMGERTRELRRAQAFRYRGRYAWGIVRIDCIEVERDSVTLRAAAYARERLRHHFGKTAALDLRHRVHADAERGKQYRLLAFETTHTDNAYMLGLKRGISPAQGVAALSKQRGKRHSVHPSRVARLRRVRIEVSIDP